MNLRTLVSVGTLICVWHGGGVGAQPSRPAIDPVGMNSAVVHVNVRVTALSGTNLYLNKGHTAGIRPGDDVTLFPPGPGIVTATVVSVSSSSSRCAVPRGGLPLPIDTRGDVLVPSQRFENAAGRPTASARNIPAHPPWSDEFDGWGDDEPLLAPIHAVPPESRAPDLHGRMFGQYLHTWNQNAGSNQYTLGRVGAALWLENPFHRNGTLEFNGELNRRGIFLHDEGYDDVRGPGWINRLSYRWGGTDEQPWQVEVGRFFPDDFPEFGLLDGTAVSYRLPAGHRVSMSVGYLPYPQPNQVTRDDFQIGVYYRWSPDEDATFSTGIGYQKTWHKGTPDRDLLVQSIDYYPNEQFSVHSTVWCDFFDRHDVHEAAPFEISQIIVQPTYLPDPSRGIGAHLSHLRWPELLRYEYTPVFIPDVNRGRVFRYGLFAWQQLGQNVRLDGRVDQWDDQGSARGTSWESGVTVREWLIPDGEVGLAFFGTQGLYSSGPGGRLRLARQFPRCYASLAYELADYDINTVATPFHTRTGGFNAFQQYLRANIDFSMPHENSISVFGDYRFGRQQDAFQLGLFYQKRL